MSQDLFAGVELNRKSSEKIALYWYITFRDILLCELLELGKRSVLTLKEESQHLYRFVVEVLIEVWALVKNWVGFFVCFWIIRSILLLICNFFFLLVDTGSKVADPCCYGHTQFHLIPDKLKRQRFIIANLEDQIEVVYRANGIASLFAWTAAQAMYQGKTVTVEFYACLCKNKQKKHLRRHG